MKRILNWIAGPSSTPPKLSGHMPALDGVRGLAILMVMLAHFYRTAGLEQIVTLQHPRTGPLIGQFLLFGTHGVDLFFVLSGFLITGILVDSKGDAHYFRNFYARRVLRIFPLYYGVLAILFLVLPLILWVAHGKLQGMGSAQVYFWLYLGNLRTTFEVVGLPLAHFWSLAVEEQFYLIWPLVVYLADRKRLIRLCIAIILLVPVLRGLFQYASFSGYGYLMPSVADELAIGGLVALLMRGGMGVAGVRRLLSAPGVVSAFVLLGLRVAWKIWPTDWWSIPWHSAVAVLGAFVLVMAVTSDSETLVGRWFKSGFLRWLGKYSYGMYIFHYLLILKFPKLFRPDVLFAHLGSAWLTYAFFVVCAGGTTAVLAWISFHYYESKFLSLKRKFEMHGDGMIGGEGNKRGERFQVTE